MNVPNNDEDINCLMNIPTSSSKSTLVPPFHQILLTRIKVSSMLLFNFTSTTGFQRDFCLLSGQFLWDPSQNPFAKYEICTYIQQSGINLREMQVPSDSSRDPVKNPQRLEEMIPGHVKTQSPRKVHNRRIVRLFCFMLEELTYRIYMCRWLEVALCHYVYLKSQQLAFVLPVVLC